MSTQSQKTENENANTIIVHTKKDLPRLDITLTLKGKPNRVITVDESFLYPLVDDLINAFGKKAVQDAVDEAYIEDEDEELDK